jgi:hypothetical protein
MGIKSDTPICSVAGSQLKLKCHAIFLDCTMNDRETVLANFYENMVVTGMKWHAALRSLVRGGAFSSTNRDYLFGMFGTGPIFPPVIHVIYFSLAARAAERSGDFLCQSGPRPDEPRQLWRPIGCAARRPPYRPALVREPALVVSKRTQSDARRCPPGWATARWSG